MDEIIKDINGIERIIAVATAAVRRAKNQRSFLDEVSATCGIKLRVLTAEEEAVVKYTRRCVDNVLQDITRIIEFFNANNTHNKISKI